MATVRAATQIPSDLATHIGRNAGIMLSDFTPSTGKISVSSIIGATSGGIQFTDTPSYVDFGEDIDNCPKNTKELKELESREVKISGTYVSLTADNAKSLIGTAIKSSSSSSSPVTVKPRDYVDASDFEKIWFVYDYGASGLVAIEVNNALSTGGFSVQTGDKSKATHSFEYQAHYSIADSATPPYTVYFITSGVTAVSDESSERAVVDDEPTATYDEVASKAVADDTTEGTEVVYADADGNVASEPTASEEVADDAAVDEVATDETANEKAVVDDTATDEVETEPEETDTDEVATSEETEEKAVVDEVVG